MRAVCSKVSGRVYETLEFDLGALAVSAHQARHCAKVSTSGIASNCNALRVNVVLFSIAMNMATMGRELTQLDACCWHLSEHEPQC